MARQITFSENYNFSDEHFDELKDRLLDDLKADFSKRYDKARSKFHIVTKEFNDLQKQQSESLEMYGLILLNRLDEHYYNRTKPVRDIIEEFGPWTMNSKEEWVERYHKAINDKETEFDFMGKQAASGQAISMSYWLKENPGFQVDPGPEKNPRCFLDLTKKEGSYYFERLAAYVAGKEYFETIGRLKHCIDEGTEDLQFDYDVLMSAKPRTLNWTSGNSKTRQIEFIKLVVALHKGGMINHGKGSVDGVLRELAQVFGVELSKNYRSNLSKHLTYQKEGHDVLKFFDELKEAFERYIDYRK